ncbi:hypothetical protein CRE_24284 [Caenorhabditis remanei]|uniref:Uncharacterized protein n=1 Tax=Caenorhabditis remanei TaxID=31234 RepID=E3NKH6_CAERE|nr:hypothetical protein CRE_24284 [Caenorhabditis remanei]
MAASSSSSSSSSAHSDCSSKSSIESISLPQYTREDSVEKRMKRIGDTVKVDEKRLAEWTDTLGPLYGSVPLCESIMDLHFQLIPAIETLKKAREHSSDKLKEEISKLIVDYTIFAVFLEKMVDQMHHDPDFLRAHNAFPTRRKRDKLCETPKE